MGRIWTGGRVQICFEYRRVIGESKERNVVRSSGTHCEGASVSLIPFFKSCGGVDPGRLQGHKHGLAKARG